jgi:hypothetical protein
VFNHRRAMRNQGAGEISIQYALHIFLYYCALDDPHRHSSIDHEVLTGYEIVRDQ